MRSLASIASCSSVFDGGHGRQDPRRFQYPVPHWQALAKSCSSAKSQLRDPKSLEQRGFHPFCRRADQLCTISRRRTDLGHLVLKTKRPPKSSSIGACVPCPLEKNHCCSTISTAFAPGLTKSAPYQCLRCRRTKPTNHDPDPRERQVRRFKGRKAQTSFPPGGRGGSRAVQPFFFFFSATKAHPNQQWATLHSTSPRTRIGPPHTGNI